MNTYRKMYVICEDEYRRLLEQNEDTVIPKVIEPQVVESIQPQVIEPIQPQVIETIQHKRRYKCMQCDKDYSDKHDLRRHVMNNHKTQQVNTVADAIIKPKPKKKRLPPRDPFVHNIKKWRTL